MKLTLEHLAPYLINKLNIKDLYSDEISILTGINTNHTEPIKVTSIRTDLGVSRSLEEIKPIFRPLSGITKEIEVNGEKFVPLKYIYGNDFTPNDDFFENMDSLSIGYREMLLLFEWHFDIFGLIEKGLAIAKD